MSRGLVFRLASLASLGLGILALPLTANERVAGLMAFGVGLIMGVISRRSDRFGSQSAGLGILLATALPASGVWIPFKMGAVVAIGVGSATRAGLSRAVPGFGLLLMAIGSVRGFERPWLIVAWGVSVLVVLALASVQGFARDSAPPLEGNPVSSNSGSGPNSGVLVVRRLAALGLAVAVMAGLVGAWSAASTSSLDEFWRRVAGRGQETASFLGLNQSASGGMTVADSLDVSDRFDLGPDANEVVLRVGADRPMFWRGNTFDQWDGRQWTKSPGGEKWEVALAAGVRPDIAPFDHTILHPELEVATLVQEFSTTASGLNVLLAAPNLEEVVMPGQGLTGVEMTVHEDLTVELARPLRANDSWIVSSSVPVVSERDLQAAELANLAVDPAIEPELLAQIQAQAQRQHERFASPSDIHPDVAQLAAEITADATTTYDKVKALENWFDENVEYTLDLAPLPEGEDAVAHLLFTSRKGFCQQIGTAMVIMARSLGIPARVAVGWVPSSFNQELNVWESGRDDAHAWAEIWFPGVGWQGFDPTAGVPLAGDSPELEPAIDPSADASAPWWRWLAGLPLGTKLALGGAMGAAAVVIMVGLRRLRGWRRSAAVGAVRLLVDAPNARFERLGAAHGCGWTPQSTFGDKGRDLVAAGLPPDQVATVVAGLEYLNYCLADMPDHPDVAMTTAQIEAAFNQLERYEAGVGGEMAVAAT